jgi:ribose transport system permease protein
LSNNTITNNPWSWSTSKGPLAVLGRYSDLRLLLAIFVAMGALGLSSNAFLTPGNLSSVGLYWAFVALAALGQLFVVIVGGIDLSVGSTMGLAGIVTASIMADGGSPYLAVAVGIGIGLAVGLFNGFFVAYIGITSFIVTLGTLQIVRGITLGYKQGQAVSGLPEGFIQIGSTPFLGIPIPIWILTGFALIVWFFLSRTAQGRELYSVGSNQLASTLTGIPVKRRILMSFTLSGVFASIAGVLVTARLGSAVPNAGVGMELIVIAAVVIGGASLAGGRGTALGVLLGALLIALVNNALVLLSVPTYWQQSFIGAVILAAAMFDLIRRRK